MLLKSYTWDFPGRAVNKNLPAKAGHTGLIPEPQLLSLSSRASESQLLKPACLEPVLHSKRRHHNEKPPRHN